MSVFVLDKHKKPLMPCSEKRAHKLLSDKRAVVHRFEPFTIRLKDITCEASQIAPLSVKIDPGSKMTGLAITNQSEEKLSSLWLGELKHRGSIISKKLEARRALRRGRRNRHTRYRAPRFDNRTRVDSRGWLAPSVLSRVIQVKNTVIRLTKLAPITKAVIENVKFDTQLMQNPDIGGIEYQRGTLYEYEVRQYLLEKWNHKCAYCGCEGKPLEIDHVQPRSKGGPDRISNLVPACVSCNRRKNNRPIESFVKDPAKLASIRKQMKAPLKDAAALNSIRKRILQEISDLLPIETGTGGQTKFNRKQHNLVKDHCIDAVCVGDIPKKVKIGQRYCNTLKANGRGNRQIANVNAFGFPKSHCSRTKVMYGFKTGDIVKADTTNRKKVLRRIIGKITVRASGSFYFIIDGKSISVSWHKCKLLQLSDGYVYSKRLLGDIHDTRKTSEESMEKPIKEVK